MICGHKSKVRPVSMIVKFFCSHFLLSGPGMKQRAISLNRGEVHCSSHREEIETEEKKLLEEWTMESKLEKDER